MLWRATVQREDGTKSHFSPDPIQAQNGDAVFWFNEDRNESHQLYPDTPTTPPGSWGDAFGPQTPSQQVNLGNAGTISYKCALHEDESGSIVVANAVIIASGVDTSSGSDFFPAVSAASGTCVSWGNSDSNAHQPCPDSGDPWFSEPINSGDLSASITFNQPKGTKVGYHCALHDNENGTVTVT